ncbi:MAG: arylsulfatase, partial [Planctomycetota bacterium]
AATGLPADETPQTSLPPRLRGGRPPNIILVMPDDMGWGDIGAHGHPLVKTPHLDRLHRESVRFTDFHVSPTCSPTRAALLSGRHEFKNGVTHTIQERERLALDTITLPQVLRGRDYLSAIFGKWHLGDEDAYQPQRRGFHEVFIHGAGGIGQTYPGSCGDAPNNKYHDPTLWHNTRFSTTKGYCTDLFFNQAMKWMAARLSGQRHAESNPDNLKASTAYDPFFVMITPNAPHAPLVSPGPKYDELYQGKSINGKALSPGDVAYYSMITNIDENIGRLLEFLDRENAAEKTLVIFLSDNGGTHTHHYSGGYRGGKVTMYSGGTHAPSFWRWPKTLPAGVDVTQLAAHIDVLPTLADMARLMPLSNPRLRDQVEGRSLLPLLLDPQAPWTDRTLVTHIGRWEKGQVAEAKYRNCSIRNQRYRLVENRALYDLAQDRGEKTDVSDQHPDVVKQLRAAYDRWWDEVQPRLVNEDAIGPATNPYHDRYYKQFGPPKM